MMDHALQLLRYAQDLEELMQQHHRLQQQHRMVLQSIGRESPSPALLPQLLAESTSLYVITDARGTVVAVSEDVARKIEVDTGELIGRTWAHCLRINPPQAATRLLEKFASGSSGAVQVQLCLMLGADQQAPALFDALVMPWNHGGVAQIAWFLQASSAQARSVCEIQQAWLATVESDKGLLQTDPFGNIRYANAAFCQTSGYGEDALRGENPRMLSAGRHDSAFYQDMWMELLEGGSWSGTLFNRRKCGQIFLQWQSIKMVENLQGEVLSYIAAVADLSHDETSSTQRRRPSHHDALTGLPNRVQLADTLSQTLLAARKHGHEVAVLYINLDHFRMVNADFGRPMGDSVLQEVANRLQAAMVPGDTLARMGADEFVVVLQGVQRLAQAQALAQRLAQAVAAPIAAVPRPIELAASLGCAIYPRDGTDMVSLLRHADAAMYGAKRSHSGFRFYDAQRDLHAKPRLEADIWHAVELGQLRLEFQPQLRSAGLGAIRGCEALVRWSHPVLGEVPADTFIHIAEDNGAIVPIGNWVLEQACAQLQAWHAQGTSELSMAVNISLRQIRDPGFEGHVREALRRQSVAPEWLELELSESETLQFRDSDTQHIAMLSGLGVRISIDDFGSSFSSLARLRALSIRSLKINSQFVRHLSNSADARVISNCMLAMGKVMGIEVIAQGVETADQARILSGQGCKVMQGFYAGRPMSGDALLALARRRNALADPYRLASLAS